MRPIRLRLKSFTAFRGEQEIDFEQLEVFAIAGPTGSGKSSLLDAMTYALFGTVDRVGKQVSQLISQGQPRMSVTLEFEVAAERYRVTRATPVKGATKILLERAHGRGAKGDEGNWQQAGDGADRVREVDAMIRERILGLDYRAFTRSVLLPQGRFHEFLTGDASERRDILAELLGLSLFKRLGAKAHEIDRSSSTGALARDEMLEHEYSGATPEALANAVVAAKQARAREKALNAAEKKVAAAAKGWAEAARAVEELRACAAEARAMASAAGAAASAAARLAERTREVSEAIEGQQRRTKEAAAEAKRAIGAREKTERMWGREADLAVAREQAVSREGLAASAAQARARLAAARDLVPARAAEAEKAARLAAEAAAARDAAEGTRNEAASLLEQARHANLITAVSAGLKPGDPCPVCGEPLAKPPARSGVAVVTKAEKAFAAAERTFRKAAEAASARERDRDRAALGSDQQAVELERLAVEADRTEAELQTATDRLAEALGGKLPAQPAEALDERIARLQELAEAETSASDLLKEIEKSAALADRALTGIRTELASHRATLEAQRVTAVIERARKAGAAAGALTEATFAAPRDPGDAEGLANAARVLADRVQRLAGDCTEAAAKGAAAESSFLAEAEVAIGDLLASPGKLTELVADVREATTRAAVEAAEAQQRATQIRERTEGRAALEAEIAGLRARARIFHALANELRSDRIIAFLQAEALEMLAKAGSTHLSTLSDGRYRLACVDDEFFVIDTWNGEERRSVRTLSGGETFLASLSLALALSAQVRSLSVTERARLDSLFLDEGFGTLDPESLRTVVDAIEQLGGDGRLVGVITHVRELAEQFPRIEVEKSPRGSRVTVVP